MTKLLTYNDVECMILIIATGSGAKAARVKGVSSTSVCEIRRKVLQKIRIAMGNAKILTFDPYKILESMAVSNDMSPAQCEQYINGLITQFHEKHKDIPTRVTTALDLFDEIYRNYHAEIYPEASINDEAEKSKTLKLKEDSESCGISMLSNKLSHFHQERLFGILQEVIEKRIKELGLTDKQVARILNISEEEFKNRKNSVQKQRYKEVLAAIRLFSRLRLFNIVVNLNDNAKFHLSLKNNTREE